HIGNARPVVVFDVLARLLRHTYGQDHVTYVRNITDIEDKIMDAAKKNGEPIEALTTRTARWYHDDMGALGALPPDREPRATEFVPQMVAMIGTLIARGNAYVAEGHVLFNVPSMPEYGQLSKRSPDDLIAGARVEKDGDKHDPLDFALWKSCGTDEWGWESPWGRGRPGWHIECSAMCSHYLGHGFDVHAGGMDLIFPHHENEVAQSEAAHPGEGPLAKLWMHNGFVNVDKEKMSKSLGNFVTVRDVLERNDAEGFRWFLLGAQYRGPLQFDTEQLASGRVIFPGVDEAERRVDYVYGASQRLSELVSAGLTAPGKLPPELLSFRDRIQKAELAAGAALDDDLNTPLTLAALGEMAQAANEVCDLAKKRKKDPIFQGAASVFARIALMGIGKVGRDLGLMQATPEEYFQRVQARRMTLRGLTAASIEAKVIARTEARKNKDFAASDAIRDELLALGVTLCDTPTSTEWSITQ
ncbi:MAG TPA: cysteine--tRNA ligase, partial [Polyangiaceae bacterium]